MAFLDLFFVALMPVLETLLVTLLGSLIATQRLNLLREIDAKNSLNNLVYYVFMPAILISDLAKTITFDRLVEMWFMLVNIVLTMVVGSILGWILNKIARTPKDIQGLVNACCAVGNLGNLPLIIVPAVCKETNSPFGDSATCSSYAEAYSSVSMGVSALFMWTYLYIVMGTNREMSTENIYNIDTTASTESLLLSRSFASTESLLLSRSFASTDNILIRYESSYNRSGTKVSILDYITWPIKKCMQRVKMEVMFSPITIAVFIGFTVGAISPIQKLMVGDSAPLRLIINSVSLVGEAAIVSMTLIIGANLLNGLKKSQISFFLIIGIMVVRFIISPILGILIVKAAQQWGFVGSYSLYHFVLMLHYALPPATAVGTIAQLLGVAESECSVIMIWTYAVSTITVTLWCTFFMWMLQ